MSIFNLLLGDPNAREIEKLQPILQRINALEPSMRARSNEELKAKTTELRERLAHNESLDDLLPDAFAVAREMAHRALKQRPYDVQLIGGIALHRGMIAEMRTGEGKTLTAVAPVYLNALIGKGVHVITVNDYLARRDTVWMGQVYAALGLTVGCIQHEGGYLYDPNFTREPQHDEARDVTGSFRVDMDYLRPVSRRDAYAADVTYGTNNEFGFDYLRDNMVPRAEEMVQRELHYAIVDEVDSILIDEARTPLIISAPAEEAAELYYRFADLVTKLEASDYVVDEKLRAATLTEQGISKIEQWLGVDNLYVQGGLPLVHHLEQALRAHALFKRDRDYVVKDGEVIIVDEFTGRLMHGRRYSEGLHQAIEAKERVEIQRESRTMATITFQNYFRLYAKLAGMTGTALTEAEEFHKIYKLEVLSIPTNKPSRRTDLPDRVYKGEVGKFRAVVAEIKRLHEKGQPVLVGTVSIEKNEILAKMLELEQIPFNMLNAKNHEKEGEFIAQAGRKGAVTLATNMAGRGVDILLGGNPPTPEAADDVRARDGLFVLGTERHESRRIDNQLRGRAGRQGDAGTTQFYVSMEDDLMRIFGSDRLKKRMELLGLPDDEAIESRMLSKAIETAQKKVEGHNFDIRKHLLEYDDVLNKHRTIIYGRRRDILRAAHQPTTEGARPLTSQVMQAVEHEIEQLVVFHTAAEDPSLWNVQDIEKAADAMFSKHVHLQDWIENRASASAEREEIVDRRTRLIDGLTSQARTSYRELEIAVGDSVKMADIEKALLLHAIDMLWVDHLDAIEHLRRGIGLQGYGQRDPLVEYKKEAYRLFNEFIAAIDRQVANAIFKIRVVEEEMHRALRQGTFDNAQIQLSGPSKEGNRTMLANEETKDTSVTEERGEKVGRNDPCPCGATKSDGSRVKYKKCHGR